MAGTANEGYYQIHLIYKSGGQTSHLYEINKEEKIAEHILYQIELLVPEIRFDGVRVYPKRISRCKVFVSDSPFDKSSDSLREDHPNGYTGNFGGRDVTYEIIKQARERGPHWQEATRQDFLALTAEVSSSASSASDLFKLLSSEDLGMDAPQIEMYYKGLNEIDKAEYHAKSLERDQRRYNSRMFRRAIIVAVITGIVGFFLEEIMLWLKRLVIALFSL